MSRNEKLKEALVRGMEKGAQARFVADSAGEVIDSKLVNKAMDGGFNPGALSPMPYGTAFDSNPSLRRGFTGDEIAKYFPEVGGSVRSRQLQGADPELQNIELTNDLLKNRIWEENWRSDALGKAVFPSAVE